MALVAEEFLWAADTCILLALGSRKIKWAGEQLRSFAAEKLAYEGVLSEETIKKKKKPSRRVLLLNSYQKGCQKGYQKSTSTLLRGLSNGLPLLCLLADAKLAEDDVHYFLHIKPSGNVTKLMRGVPQRLCYKHNIGRVRERLT